MSANGGIRWKILGHSLEPVADLPAICKLKEFKKIAMRSAKTDTSCTAMIYAAAATITSR